MARRRSRTRWRLRSSPAISSEVRARVRDEMVRIVVQSQSDTDVDVWAAERKVDVVITNVKWPSPKVLGRYALEHKEPLATGQLPDHCEVVGGEFWTSEIARHDRLRLAYAVWTVLSRRLLGDA